MKFKDLTSEQIAKAKKIYTDKSMPWDKRMKKLMSFFGKSERTVRKWCSEKLNFKEKNEVVCEQYEQAKLKVADHNKKKFIITWAQNNTPVSQPFFENLLAYADFLNAGIHVIAGRYKNPTSVFTDNEYDFWVDEVLPYLDANRHDIHKYLSVMSDVKIQPTAVNPMSGMEGISGINSCIFGSPKVQMQMIPVLTNNYPKMMATTGACTIKNYTDSKSGKKGEFHHTLGFVVVELKDEKVFFARQVTADENTGNFNDLFYSVEDGVVKNNENIEGIVLGDLHYGQHDDSVLEKTIELMNILKPKHVVLHDVFDGYSINHHEMKNPFVQYAKEVHGTNSLEKEIGEMINGLKNFEKFENVIIVRGNHDDFVDRWLINEDWKKQPTSKNSLAYMEYSTMLLKQYSETPQNVKGIIPTVINKNFPKFITLKKNDSYKIKNWEVGQHGDTGPNGSRGSLMAFRRLNTKIITAHSHTPGRMDGALVVGTTTNLRLGYNNGPSSWLQSHVIIHKDGKAQHINFINSEYTTLKK
jgi:Calcineurin-like phosphoesterase